MLKADLHMHCNEDPEDIIAFSWKQLIDKAAALEYEVLSITLHNRLFFPKELQDYAQQKNILLLPGIEITINKAHVLFYNITEEEAKSIKTFEDIKKVRRENTLIVAPHPFFPDKSCMKDQLYKHADLFDAVEWCYMYTSLINFNKKGKKAADSLQKPMIANSDCHYLENLGIQYSLIDAEKDINSIIKAIKAGKVEMKTKPLSHFKVTHTMAKHFFCNSLPRKLRGRR